VQGKNGQEQKKKKDYDEPHLALNEEMQPI